MNKLKFLNLTVLFILVILTIIKQDYGQNDITTISIMSISLMIAQIVILMRRGYGLVSFQSIFIILSYLFNFSFFWLIFFGKSDFIFFPQWIYTELPNKCNAAFYSLMCIQGVFTGLVWTNVLVVRNDNNYLYFENRNNRKQVFKVGLLLFFIGLPFKLYYDYLNIANSIANGGYGGYGGVSGLTDDFQHFAIAGIITMIASGFKKKYFAYGLIILSFAYFFIVMLASGDRRYYITAIIGIVMAFIGSYLKNSGLKSKKYNKLLVFFALFIVGLFILNLITIIRYQRGDSLGTEMMVGSSIDQLFSFDGFWETLGEFGITINALVIAKAVVPSVIPFQYGLSYIYAIIYILPIGSFIHIPNASIGRAVTSYLDVPVGSSYILDLYANFGVVSFLPAIFLGVFMSKIVGLHRSNSIKGLAISSAITYILINYVRSSTIEVLRPIVYIIVMYYFIEHFIIRRQ